VNIVHFVTPQNFKAQSDLAIISGLPYHKPLSFTWHTFTDLLNKPSNVLKLGKRLQRLGFWGNPQQQLAHGVRIYCIRQTPFSSLERGLGTRLLTVLQEIHL